MLLQWTSNPVGLCGVLTQLGRLPSLQNGARDFASRVEWMHALKAFGFGSGLPEMKQKLNFTPEV